MTVVYQPSRPHHHCGPNEHGHWLEAWNDQAGTVRECPACGKSWVAYRDRCDPGYMGVKWRREGWLSRRRRRRGDNRESVMDPDYNPPSMSLLLPSDHPD